MNVKATEHTHRVDGRARIPGGSAEPRPVAMRDRLELSRLRRDGHAPRRSLWKPIGILAGGVASLAAGIFLMPFNPVAGGVFALLGGSVIYNGVRSLSDRR